MYKTVFRMIKGRLVPLKINEFTISGLHHSNRNVEGGKQALGIWKKLKSSLFARAELYKPGNVFDPKAIEESRNIFREHSLRQLSNAIKMKFPKHDIGAKYGEKAAEKAKSFIETTEDLFGLGPKQVEHLSSAEILKKAKAGISKRQFSEALGDEYSFMNVPRYIKEAGMEMFELPERGGYGVKSFIKTFSGQRKRDALRFYKEAKIQLPKTETIDRLINARGKGIKFIKRNGKLVPVKK